MCWYFFCRSKPWKTKITFCYFDSEGGRTGTLRKKIGRHNAPMLYPYSRINDTSTNGTDLYILVPYDTSNDTDGIPQGYAPPMTLTRGPLGVCPLNHILLFLMIRHWPGVPGEYVHPLHGVVGWGKSVMYLASPRRPTDINLQLDKDWGGMLLFLLFLHFHSFSSFSDPLFHLVYYLFCLSSPFLWETTQNDPQGLTSR